MMVMEALGPSLDSLHEFCLREFSEMTLALVGIQCIRRLEWIHSKGFIHRDIKPENFLIGSKSKEDTIFIIDFGLAKRYLDPKTGQHIAFKKHKGCFGTQRYQSLRATFGHEQSRRDDLEALGYMLAYFANKGSLPWMRK